MLLKVLDGTFHKPHERVLGKLPQNYNNRSKILLNIFGTAFPFPRVQINTSNFNIANFNSYIQNNHSFFFRSDLHLLQYTYGNSLP